MTEQFDLSQMSDSEILRICKPKKSSIAPKRKRKIVPAKGKTEWGRRYDDGREVCADTPAGLREYKRRTLEMAERQNWICGCGCGQGMFRTPGYRHSVTFGHDGLRGLGGGTRDDRIEDEFGNPMNHAETWECNVRKGSKRN